MCFAVESRINPGTVTAMSRCETHGMEMENPTALGDMCAIGRIETATEEALTKIAEAPGYHRDSGLR
jgi:hypothetical protein